jgi:epoxyqueuosine reductase
MTASDNSKKIKDRILAYGADVVGIADMSRYNREILGFGEDLRPQFPYAISYGLLVPQGVLDTLVDGPTLFYLHHYRQVNYRLDMIAYEMARELEREGHKVLPFAASQMVDWKDQLGHLSHKHMAVYAGNGWIGRNNLLVNGTYGSRLRLNTILVNMHLEADEPAQFSCGQCKACISSCPGDAIKDLPDDFDHRGCFATMQVFKNKRNLGHHICGLCVKACKGVNP